MNKFGKYISCAALVGCFATNNAVAGQNDSGTVTLYRLIYGTQISNFHSTKEAACGEDEFTATNNMVYTSKVFIDSVSKCDASSPGWVIKYGRQWAKLSPTARLESHTNVVVDMFEFENKFDSCGPLAQWFSNVTHRVNYVWDRGEYGYDGSLKIAVSNASGKRVKYAYISVTGVNAVGDKMFTEKLRGIGPVENNGYGQWHFDNLNFRLVKTVKIDSIRLEYVGGGIKQINMKGATVSPNDEENMIALGMCWGEFNFFGL